MAGDGFANLADELFCCSTFGATASAIGVDGAGDCTVLLNSAFDMATTGENSFRLISLEKEINSMLLRLRRKKKKCFFLSTYQELIFGVASFPLRIKNGNKQANIHPLK